MWFWIKATLASVLGLFYLKTNNSHGKGWLAEYVLHKLLEKELKGQDARIFRDVLLERPNGRLSQIDLIVACRRGIFVIEVKNLNGQIFGSKEDKRWMQALAYRHSKRYFYSPLKQNATHLKAVQEVLGVAPAKLFNVVALSGFGKLITPIPGVLSLGRVPQYILRQRSSRLSQSEVDAFAAALKQAHRADQEAREKHQTQVESYKGGNRPEKAPTGPLRPAVRTSRRPSRQFKKT
ncbi:nuclease-related domain-containing protein [Thioalkalivibrio thiocyanodenitrificans]|uniref:nuclease-related domain-containing protein n=1 Tax=Thioalkalivibrio thiocyanodenitrificans TaxID=243063 RepID=UPI00037F80F6|nr:nuclease-related domain-containing protein [Thioalkalivibrio thiocyanodenitrificans]